MRASQARHSVRRKVAMFPPAYHSERKLFHFVTPITLTAERLTEEFHSPAFASSNFMPELRAVCVRFFELV
jgi:hypothetical protein